MRCFSSHAALATASPCAPKDGCPSYISIAGCRLEASNSRRSARRHGAGSPLVRSCRRGRRRVPCPRRPRSGSTRTRPGARGRVPAWTPPRRAGRRTRHSMAGPSCSRNVASTVRGAPCESIVARPRPRLAIQRGYALQGLAGMPERGECRGCWARGRRPDRQAIPAGLRTAAAGSSGAAPRPKRLTATIDSMFSCDIQRGRAPDSFAADRTKDEREGNRPLVRSMTFEPRRATATIPRICWCR